MSDELDLKLPDGGEYKGDLQGALSSLPSSMQPDLQRIGADMAQRNAPAGGSAAELPAQAAEYYGNVEKDRQKWQGQLDQDLLKNEQERKAVTDEMKQTVERGPGRVAQPAVPKLTPHEITPVFGALMALAALAGSGARNHAVGALNAMNGVMEGSARGDKELYDRSMKEYEQKSKQAIEAQKEMTDEWNKKIRVGEMTREELDHEAHMFSLKYPQLKIDESILRGEPGHMFHVMDAAAKSVETARKEHDKFLANQSPMAKLTDGGAGIQQAFELSHIPLPGGNSKFAMARNVDMFNRMAEQGVTPEAAVRQYMTSTADKTALTNTVNREAAVDRITGAVQNLEPKVVELTNKLNDKLPGHWANQTINSLIGKFGDDADLAELRNLTFALGREYVAATTMPGSNAQMHVSHTEDAERMANGNMPPAMLAGALKGINEDIAASKDSLSAERNRLMDDILKGVGGKPTPASPTHPAASSLPAKNTKGWALHKDKDGNQAYVSPDGKQFEEAK